MEKDGIRGPTRKDLYDWSNMIDEHFRSNQDLVVRYLLFMPIIEDLDDVEREVQLNKLINSRS